MPTVFLSSTSKDLAPFREAAFRAIQGLDGYLCMRMEDFSSWDEEPDDFCRAKVAQCDLFVCMAGPLYGSLAPAGKSYTQREYEAAIAKHKPCLVFLTAEDFPLAANLIESDEQRSRQALFRNTIKKGRIVTWFSTPDQVSTKVVQTIRNWEASQAAAAATQETIVASQISSVLYRVAVLNHSSLLSDEEVRTAVAAFQKQVHRDFAPVWGIDAEVKFLAKGEEPEPASWQLVVEDVAEYPEMVSYHTVTAEGLPQVKISVVNARHENWPWTMAASHDLLEMLANPRVNLTVFVEGKKETGTIYRQEICDPVATPELCYEIDGIVVSDFVYPAWFESFRQPGTTRFDQCGHLFAPFTRAPGGYSNVFEVGSGSGWTAYWEPTESVPNRETGATKKKSASSRSKRDHAEKSERS
jgi:hypothetical protein